MKEISPEAAQLIYCHVGTCFSFPRFLLCFFGGTQEQFNYFYKMWIWFKFSESVARFEKALHNVPISPYLLIISIRRHYGVHITSTFLGFFWMERQRKDDNAPWSRMSMRDTTGPRNYETTWDSRQCSGRARDQNASKSLILLWGHKGTIAKITSQNQGNKAVFSICIMKRVLENHNICSMRRGVRSTLLWL